MSKAGCVVGAVFLFLCVSFVLYFTQSTLNFSNPNFFSVHVQSISSQVLYMKSVIGTELLHNVTTVLPLSVCQVQDFSHSKYNQSRCLSPLLFYTILMFPLHRCRYIITTAVSVPFHISHITLMAIFKQFASSPISVVGFLCGCVAAGANSCANLPTAENSNHKHDRTNNQWLSGPLTITS